MFSQLLPLIDRAEFDRLVRLTGAQKGAKGFSCWEQFVSMLFCQLGRANSLREICGGLASCAGKISHLGMKHAPNKSSLAYANAHRSAELYEKLFHSLLGQMRGRCGRHKCRFKNPLISIDASLIQLSLSMYEWAEFRRTKGALKLHLQLDHDGYLPCYAFFTNARTHEIKVARSMSFQPGSILVFDRGYNDYAWFYRLTMDKVFFVTRLKANATLEIVEEWEVPAGSNVVKDQIIRLSGPRAGQDYPGQLRRVCIFDHKRLKVLQFLTNNMTLSASTIAAIYKQRWQIELFFKAIKQNLKIKTFLGTTFNAVMTQMWTALIAMLLLQYLRWKSSFCWSLSQLLAMLRFNLFTHTNLFEWLDDPYKPVPEPPNLERQLSLDLAI
jgi:hypothetical protein